MRIVYVFPPAGLDEVISVVDENHAGTKPPYLSLTTGDKYKVHSQGKYNNAINILKGNQLYNLYLYKRFRYPYKNEQKRF